MRASTVTGLCILVLFSFIAAVPAQLKFFSFDTDFIEAQYPNDSAISRLQTRQFARAKNAHSIECSGNDGELHIGVLLADIVLPAGQNPSTSPVVAGDPGWGIVAELPNVKQSNGIAMLDKLKNKPVLFEGYFRVWDEGHSHGAVHPSNTHHVFEVHPATGFSGDGTTFSKPNLVNSIAKYAGFGRSKFEPMLKKISAGDWPRVFKSGGQLHLGLQEAENFYQLPVKIKKITTVTGGREFTMDVFTSNTFATLLFKDLAGITVDGSPTQTKLKVGDKTFLLGFFSVNLKKALAAASGATSQTSAKPAQSALEFFIFGPAMLAAVKTCSKKEPDQ
jgi:hypothetical protein